MSYYPRHSPLVVRSLRWDEEAREYYYSYDEANDRRVYRSGQQIQRPAYIPRSGLAFQPSDLPSNQYDQDPPGLDEPSYRHFGHQSGNESGSSQGSATTSGFSVRIPRVSPSETRTITEEGRPVVHAFNRQSHVATRLVTSPIHQISDLDLASHGIPIQHTLLPTAGDHGLLFPSYKVRESGFFRVGRVFLILWAEPAGEASVQTTVTNVTKAHLPNPGVIPGRYGESVHSKVRRFVVVRSSNQFCTALPILSYGGKGVGKAGTIKSEHAIIFSGNTPPDPLPTESPSREELPMQPNPIRVVVDDARNDRLDSMSRLHLGQPHTVHHNIKVKPFGMVHQRSMLHLTTQFLQVWLPALREQELAELTRSLDRAL